jgi:hypothetical protein
VEAQRRALEALIAGAVVEQHEAKRVVECHVGELQRRGGGHNRVAGREGALEAAVSRALRGHEHMFAWIGARHAANRAERYRFGHTRARTPW